ncbi:MAG: hypothetical protein Kow0010_12770 [Dehalococcoidia bacterium]
MTDRDDVGAAIAFFATCDDIVLLHRLSADIARRVKPMVRRMIARGGEEAIPPPAEVEPASTPASAGQAIATLEHTADFALLQALARAIGRRIEALEIVASASCPVGARVSVPEYVAFPPPTRRLTGVVTATGTNLRVQLDDGTTWEGPPSLASVEHAP